VRISAENGKQKFSPQRSIFTAKPRRFGPRKVTLCRVKISVPVIFSNWLIFSMFSAFESGKWHLMPLVFSKLSALGIWQIGQGFWT
jgi:hypothetical protein